MNCAAKFTQAIARDDMITIIKTLFLGDLINYSQIVCPMNIGAQLIIRNNPI
jgi:hypothetical protein